MRRLQFLFSPILMIFLMLSSLFAQESQLARYPALNKDGSKIALSYQGDIWMVPVEGGQAVRMTIHEGYEGYPQWSPKNDAIAFSSDRFGNFDLYVTKINGAVPKRITYHSENDILTDWTPDDNLFFTTERVFKQIEWMDELRKVSASGGTPQMAFNAVGEMGTMSPNKRFIAFVRGYCRTTREDYRGPANKDIWIYDTKEDKYTQLTEFDGNEFYPQWGDNQSIYFISAKPGKYNVYKLTIDENGSRQSEEQVTNFEENGVRYLSVSGDGSKLVFEKGTNIFIHDIASNNTSKVQFYTPSDYRFDPMEHKTFTSKASNYSVSPNGKYTALVIRGEVFVKENDKDENRAVNLSEHPYRDMDLDWLNDSTVVFLSDRDGNYDIYMARSSDEDESNIFKSLHHEVVQITDTDEDEQNILISPDGKKIAYTIGRGKFVTADISGEGELSNEKVLLDGWASPGGVSWSPDSKWLAYSLDDLNFNSEIYIHAADNSEEPVNVSMHPRGDMRPIWSADGSKLGFISERNNSNYDVWFAWLKKADWLRTEEEWKDYKEEKEENKEKDTSKTVEPVEIDFDGIHKRLVQVTSLPSDEYNYEISKDGETFYFTASSNTAKGTDLYKIKWDGDDLKEITSGGQRPYGLSLEEEGKYLYMLKRGGSLARLKTDNDKLETLPYKAKMTINHPKEQEQKFEEAWRTLKVGFYDPNFHGNDWAALKEKYKPWAMKASTERDFRAMFNVMLGQINASHMGMYGSDRAETQDETTGLLGLELKPSDDGMVVDRVVMNSPADKSFSKIEPGETILSVNGNKVNDENNFYSYLVNTVDEEVVLEVENEDGEEREVVIRPTRSLNNELYEEWVEERKELTEKYSNGRLGYLHIEGMSWPSFERFERELTASGLGKEGIVIDVRFNGGGWTTDYLMTVLNVDQHAYTVPRGATDNLEKNHEKFREHYPYGERLPYAAWTKPSIAMCNQNSYSNAEIFSHAYKTLGIGKLVGKPTFGAVISTGGRGLIDGSYVRLPFRGWYVKATDMNMELNPAVPDIVVDNEPDSKAEGRDEQLKKAVDELLKQIDSE